MLACEAAMSRSSFAERFARVVGMTPLNYLVVPEKVNGASKQAGLWVRKVER